MSSSELRENIDKFNIQIGKKSIKQHIFEFHDFNLHMPSKDDISKFDVIKLHVIVICQLRGIWE